MNIFQKVTLKNLKENRTRTLVTIVGIILSAAMFTATTVSISSLQHYLVQSAIFNSGDWYGVAYGISAEEREQLLADAKVEQAVSMEFLGYSALEGCLNEDKPYLCVYGVQPDFTEMMPIHLLQGRMPANSQEILLPDHLRTNGGIEHSLDEKLEITLGDRITQDGNLLRNQDPFLAAEEESSQNLGSMENASQDLESAENTSQNLESDGEDSQNLDLGEAENSADSSARERLLPKDEKSYTIVGFYERPDFEPYTAPGYTALTAADGEGDTAHPYDLYVRTVSGRNSTVILEGMFSRLQGFDPQAEGSGVSWGFNYDLMRYYGYSGESRYNNVMYSLGAILIGIIMFGSISLIYNAFSISVSERTKQFGLLASIGGTKRQLTGSVLFEALFLGCIGIPLGILSGLAGIGITFYFVKDMVGNILGIISTSYETARLIRILGPAKHVTLTMHPSLGALAIALLISLATILISAYLPMRRAMKRPAIDAIRQAGDIAIRPGKVRTSRLTQKLFGFEGALATKNYKRNRRKYRATVISLFLSIVLFISTSSWCAYLTQSAGLVVSDSGFDISYHLPSENRVPLDSLYEDLSSASGITAASYSAHLYLLSSIQTSALSQEFLDYQKLLAKQMDYTYQNYDTTMLEFTLNFLEDESYLAYLKELKLPESVFYNPNSPTAVAVDTLWLYNETDGKYYTFSALANASGGSPTAYLTRTKDNYYLNDRNRDKTTGRFYFTFCDNDTYDEIRLPIEEACLPIPLSIGATAKTVPSFFSDSNDTIQLFYPYSFLGQILSGLEPGVEYVELPQEHSPEMPVSVAMYFRCQNHQNTEAEMVQKLSDWNLTSDGLYNYASNMEGERAMMTVINVFAFGFITLISLIAAANVFNTISTNINLRQREFAMLQSIGMTPQGFRKMMNFECLLYGIKGLLYGIPVSIGVTWLIHRAVSNGVNQNFFIPWYSIVIAVGSVFLVVFATMVYSMRKIRKKNTIDTLKNENL